MHIKQINDEYYQISTVEVDVISLPLPSGYDWISFDFFVRKGARKHVKNVWINEYTVGGLQIPFLVISKEFVGEAKCYTTVSHFIEDSYNHQYKILDTHQACCSINYDDWRFAQTPTPLGHFKTHTKVGVIIPTSNIELVKSCLQSLESDAGYIELDIAVAWYGDFQSYCNACDEPMRTGKLQKLSFHHVDSKDKFNYSAVNNEMYKYVKSNEFVLLLNDDVELDEYAIAHMLSVALDTGAKVVGAELRYPETWEDDEYQHCGVELGEASELFAHVYRGKPRKNPMYFAPTRQVSAVTFAMALIESKWYDKLGGLDERFYGDVNDIDFCLRTLREGGDIWYSSSATAVHLESKTRKVSPDMQGDENSRIFYNENLEELKKRFVYK